MAQLQPGRGSALDTGWWPEAVGGLGYGLRRIGSSARAAGPGSTDEALLTDRGRAA